jgi:hypothetical protein
VQASTVMTKVVADYKLGFPPARTNSVMPHLLRASNPGYSLGAVAT